MSRRTFDALFVLAILVVAAAAVWDARQWEIKARLFPWVIGFPVLGLAALLLVLQLTGVMKASRPTMESAGVVEVDPETATRRGLAILSWLLGFAAAVWVLNFLWGGTLATLAYLKQGAQERWPMSLAVSAGTWLTIEIMWELLNIPFPKGASFELLGIDPWPPPLVTSILGLLRSLLAI